MRPLKPDFSACALEDFPQWRKGRSRYAVWTLLLEDKTLNQHVTSWQTHFSDWLHPQARQLHLTVFVAGFPCSIPHHNDCISYAALEQQKQAIKQLHLAPFALTLKSVESFPHAPYVAVTDSEQGLEKLRQCLARIHPEQRYSEYIPHITLGLYRKNLTLAQFTQRLTHKELLPLRWLACRLHLQTYAACDQRSRLISEWSYSLAD